ncbi:transcriptional regulator [Ornithobacterium rhinotracheale]|uniref:transcriptional regulator n=1 Tax=Ornithobacterium rhinotracheale TaxID=28251 RepID=UPI00129C6785|nr:transcriptional regulator [Ornithobacterium rhinotracheale]MRJ11623.1 transcriptional regulator [Ornithobacterium rhinotracheale]
METITKQKSKFKVGEKVLISPEVTHKENWIEGVVIDVEDNPFVGFVISAETKDENIYFEKEYLFKKINE